MIRWQGKAFNQVPHSKNQIHGNDMAKQYGFKGGLVPGVTVSAYLVHPAVELFGQDFLNRGFARCRVNSPLYDGETFDVALSEVTEDTCQSVLCREDGTPLAAADICIAQSLPSAPAMRGDPPVSKDLLPATPQNMEQLRQAGCRSIVYTWDGTHEMSSYLRQADLMAGVFHQERFANPSYVLGLSNWALSSNIYMNPWVHLETSWQNHAAIAMGTTIVAETAIADLFEKKGHEFVDADINLFNQADESCVATIRLRAIYQLRGA